MGLFPSDGDPYVPSEDEDLSGPAWSTDPDTEEYAAWTYEGSRVISGPLGENSKHRGTRHSTWQAAEAYCQSKYRVLSFGVLPGRWLARIKK